MHSLLYALNTYLGEQREIFGTENLIFWEIKLKLTTKHNLSWRKKKLISSLKHTLIFKPDKCLNQFPMESEISKK